MKTISTRATWATRIAGYAFFLAVGWFAAAAVSDFYLRDQASTFCRTIVEGDRGSYASKLAAFEAAGVPVAEYVTDVPALVRRRLRGG